MIKKLQQQLSTQARVNRFRFIATGAGAWSAEVLPAVSPAPTSLGYHATMSRIRITGGAWRSRLIQCVF
jgi:hypothetical protein